MPRLMTLFLPSHENALVSGGYFSVVSKHHSIGCRKTGHCVQKRKCKAKALLHETCCKPLSKASPNKCVVHGDLTIFAEEIHIGL